MRFVRFIVIMLEKIDTDFVQVESFTQIATHLYSGWCCFDGKIFTLSFFGYTTTDVTSSATCAGCDYYDQDEDKKKRRNEATPSATGRWQSRISIPVQLNAVHS